MIYGLIQIKCVIKSSNFYYDSFIILINMDYTSLRYVAVTNPEML